MDHARDADADERDLIRTALKLDDDAARSLGAESGRPDATVHADAIEVRVILPPTKQDAKPIPLRILVGDNWIVTSHAQPATFLEEHRERITDERQLGLLTPVQFLASLLDWQVDAFFAAADRLENEVDELDDAALAAASDGSSSPKKSGRDSSAYSSRCGLSSVGCAPRGAAWRRAGRGCPDRCALASLAGRLDRASEAIGHAREMLIGTFDVHMTRTAQRTNDIMRVLTLASVILLPSVVLAGVMGMNFKVGLFENANLFWLVLLVMGVMAVATVGVARWKRWL
ncbi:MAG: CorA family divalent cation transporter [Chloroflexota bacterium]